MTLISPEQSTAWYEAKGLALGEQTDAPDRCSECQGPTLADELVTLDGQDVCLGCLLLLTGDDPHAPSASRVL